MKLLIPKERCRYRFYALFSLCIFLLFLDHVLLVSIPALAFVGILGITAFIGDEDELISVCICCISWSQAIKWYLVVACCIMIFLFKYGRKIKLDIGILPIMLIVIWEFLHCFSDGVNLKEMASFLLMYLFFVLIFFARDMKAVDYNFIMRNFAIAVLGVCCILVLRLLVSNDFNFDKSFLDMQRLGLTDEENGAMVINPNSLGILCVLSVGGLIQIRNTGQKKIFDIFLIVLILVLGALTCSRTYLVCLLILGVFLFVVSDIGVKGKLKFLFGSIFITLLSIQLLYLFFPATLEMFALRLGVKDITNGRSDLFIEYNNYLASSVKAFFWGLGSLNLAENVHKYSISFNVPHNGIQEILVAWGILGLLLFIAMILVMIRRSKQENPNQSWANYALLVVLFAKIMVGQVITSSYTMLAFALVYLSLCQDLTPKSKLE